MKKINGLFVVAVMCIMSHAIVEPCRAQTPSTGGFEGGTEVTLLNLYSNHGVGNAGGGNSWFEDDSTVGNVRYWLGYKTEDRLGLRLKYWDFYSNVDGVNQFFDTKVFDIEGTSDFSLGEWALTGSAGVRWNDTVWSDENGGDGFNFEGVGPSLGVSARRNLVGNLNFVGGVMGSVLYGDIKELTSDDQANGVSTNIIESRLGLEYFFPVRGGFVSLRGGWENQWYSGLSGNVDNDIDPEDLDVNLGGPVISISFER
ncbi:Lpg1974 family pore-forming outer membrane protein [Planctomycetaceae bacterium SH139]